MEFDSLDYEPYAELTAEQLAGWIEQQGPESWWSIDGERRLMGVIPFPCTSQVLANELRQVGGKLHLLSSRRKSVDDDASIGETIEKAADFSGDRQEIMVALRWVDASPEKNWLLMEDKETPQLVQGIPEEAGPGDAEV